MNEYSKRRPINSLGLAVAAALAVGGLPLAQTALAQPEPRRRSYTAGDAERIDAARAKRARKDAARIPCR